MSYLNLGKIDVIFKGPESLDIEFQPEEDYHSSHSSQDESDNDEEPLPPLPKKSEEFTAFENDTHNVFEEDEAKEIAQEDKPGKPKLFYHMEFPTIVECRRHLRRYCIAYNFEVSIPKNESYRLELNARFRGAHGLLTLEEEMMDLQ
ncbi:hypothetical protein FRX31_020122 [Thalictrum thalictroides]|uniref:Uncharacterized protein n=1 Tax=Thalictrum thalictroides TaxID=46969 RepID=A0A7J6VZI1_THATH|nr:hypothetical protein FRX31_020122 [Thalictrum thalictroides]